MTDAPPPRQSLVMQAVTATSKPLPKWVGVAGVALSAVAAIGHDQLVTVFGKWLASLIPILAAVMAAVSHSLQGNGGRE